jgi:hypothetical protein
LSRGEHVGPLYPIDSTSIRISQWLR